MAKSASGVVYFVAPVGGGLVKIGHSTRMEARFRGLAHGSPLKLELLATACGSSHDERAVHTAFIAHWSHGEWFAPAPEILDLIAVVRETGVLPARFQNRRRLRCPFVRAPRGKRTPEQRARMGEAQRLFRSKSREAA